MGGYIERRTAAEIRLRAFFLACAAAAVALVALPTGASADPRVPPPGCSSGLSLQGIERAPGGVIFTGRVVATNPDVGGVTLAVDAWYHRGPIAGLAAGEHPRQIDLDLGTGMSRAGEIAPTVVPAIGSRWIVAGTWPQRTRGVDVSCGILADLASRTGVGWQARADARYASIPPTPDVPAGIPLDEPWMPLALMALCCGLAAALFGTIAESRGPLSAA